MTQDLIFLVENHLGIITLNRQHALNALTHEMILALSQKLTDWELDPNIHAIVIQAAPGRAFCAGGDIRSLYHYGRNNPSASMAFFRDEYRLNHQIYTLKKPYIALMNGLTFGGGVGISLHGKYPVASERFIFAMPETSIGFFPDIAASHILSRCQNGLSLYLGLTGNQVGHELALSCGFIHSVIPAVLFPQFLSELIHADLSSSPHSMVESCIQTYRTSTDNSHNEFEHIDTLKACFDDVQGMPDIISKLQAQSNAWSLETTETLMLKSPMSLCVTFEQLKFAKRKALAECLEMDYGLTYQFMQHADFYEGTRALLIDKDKSPQWFPKTIQDITSEQIQSYFEPLPETIKPLGIR